MNTKANLLDTAETLVRTRGYDAFSFADLADAAGIRKPSVHYHFQTKGALAVALISRYRKRMMTALSELDQSDMPASIKLRKVAEIYRDALGEGDTICLCAAFSAGRDSLPDIAKAELAVYYADMKQWLSNAFSDDLAMPIIAQLEGAQLLARTHGSVQIFDIATQPIWAALDTNLTK